MGWDACLFHMDAVGPCQPDGEDLLYLRGYISNIGERCVPALIFAPWNLINDWGGAASQSV